MRSTFHLTSKGERLKSVPSKSGSASEQKGFNPKQLRSVWPQVKDLIAPRKNLLISGFVLILISRLAGMVLPASTKFLIDDVLIGRRFEVLTPLVLTVLAATIIQGVSAFVLTRMLSIGAQKLISELRQKIQRHVGFLPLRYYDNNKTGALVSRIMNDVEGVRNLVGTGLIEFAGGLLTAVVSFFVLVAISPTMTLVTALSVGFFGVILQQAFTKIRPIFKERGKIQSEVTGRLTESLGGVRVIKGYRAEAREESVFREGVTRLLNNVLQSMTAISVMALSSTVLLGLVGAGVMFVGAQQIQAGKLTIGSFVTFTSFLAFLVAPVFQIVGIGTQLTEAFAGLERTREVLEEQTEEQDPKRLIDLPTIRGHVRFNTVEFEYEAGKPVLHQITLDAPPGTVTALVGSSGSGKSTIINLICGFYSPSAGSITVDDVDLQSVKLSSYRTQMGVVLQETFLFDGTVRENILFSRPDAAEEEFMDACRLANVDEFALRMPNQYDTVVGERGVKLSGGQRQRVSIARAILAQPRILILDEATSSLDSESEALIQKGLSHLMQDRTTFVIAHRLSTIRKADQILVVEGGRIVERGQHDQLISAGGRYFDLYTRQHGLEQNLFLAPGEGDTGAEPRSL
jgi:ABC-type multidrug transport system fused ATPase/permease subunit